MPHAPLVKGVLVMDDTGKLEKTWWDYARDTVHDGVKFVDDNLLEPSGARSYLDEWGFDEAAKDVLKKDGDGVLGATKEIITHSLTSSYGVTGGLAFLYMSMWRGSSLAMSGAVAAAVMATVGRYLDPYFEQFREYIDSFNKEANPDATPEAGIDQTVNASRLGMEP